MRSGRLLSAALGILLLLAGVAVDVHATVSSTTSRLNYFGSDSTAVYAYTFRILAASDLLVTKRTIATGAEATLALTTDYTVTGVGVGSGGSITLTAGNLPSTHTLTIRRVLPLTQLTDLRNQGPFLAETHETAFDRFIMIHQQQQDLLGRSVSLPESVPPSLFNPILPATIVSASGKYLAVNGTGTAWELIPVNAGSSLTSPAITGTVTGGAVYENIVPQLASYATASLPAAGTAGRLARVTDGIRGIWKDTGTAWVSVTGYADVAADFATGGTGTSGSPWSGFRTDINALPANTHVHFRSGSYTLSASIRAKDGWKITGDGYATRIKADGVSTFKVTPEPNPYTGDGGLIVLYGTNKASVSSLVLDGNRTTKSNGAIYGIELLGDDGTMIQNVWIEDIPSGVNNGVEGDGIIIGHSARGTSSALIDQVRIKNFNRTGITINRSTQVTISNFVITNSLDANTGAGIDIEPDSEQTALDVTISNGVITSTEWGITLVGDTTTAPRVRNVAISNVAINDINDAGLYLHGENISVSNCVLRDTNNSASGAGGRGAIHFPDTISAALITTRVSITGCTIYQSGGHGIHFGDVKDLTITGNTIKESAASGIHVAFATDNIHKDNIVIADNIIIDNNNLASSNESGILFEADTALRLLRYLTIAGNTITDTQATKTQKYAINNLATNSDVTTWSIGPNYLGTGLTGVTAGIDGVAAKFSGVIALPVATGTAPLIVASTTPVNNLSLGGGTGTAINTARIKATSGTALVAGDVALSAGWGTTATVSAISGTDQRFRFTITPAGAGQAANSTATLAFKDGTWTNAPFAVCNRNGGNQASVLPTWTTTATTLVMTWPGTPSITETYTFECVVMG